LTTQAQNTLNTTHEKNIDQLVEEALSSDLAWNRLTYMADTFGPRFSGSQNLEDAMDWIIEEMKNDGFDNVWGNP